MAGNHEAPGGHRRKRKRRGSSQKILIICLILLLIVATGVIVWLVSKSESGPGNNPEPESTAQTTQSEHGGLVVPERPEMIDITAYESLELKADTLEQSVRFDNPLQNNCWLVITLSLEDGTVHFSAELTLECENAPIQDSYQLSLWICTEDVDLEGNPIEGTRRSQDWIVTLTPEKAE